MALGALKGRTLCKNVGVNPTRTGILTAFDRLGVRYVLQNERLSCGEEVADILVEKSPLRAIEITQEDVPKMVDELPLVALLCAFADGESRISGAKELRVKESDRIRATRELIESVGGVCEEKEDGWIIRGRKTLQGGAVKTYLDHRIAMTGAVALAASVNGGTVDEPSCCAISFPNFFDLLEETKGTGVR
jgi:3-phosphoshikimate 1-carboxyvinyltransferase